jgi:hypothetical protein
VIRPGRRFRVQMWTAPSRAMATTCLEFLRRPVVLALPICGAIDAGVAAGASTDQRGLPRTFNDPGVANAPTSDGSDMGAFERQPRHSRCDLCCPNNMTVPSDRSRKGAIVTYEMPEAKGCGRVKCTPPSGSFFALGLTIVTCYSEAGPECSFKVTVKGLQLSNPKE